jgi:hypothetical protein
VIFNRFAKETRRCVEAAVEEARMLGHDSIGDEDLLPEKAPRWSERRLRWL